ncbi:MAG: hypothetical protein ABW026_05205 [Microvirga sp.]
MSDPKNDSNKTPSAKPAESSSKVSAGTSVGDIGRSPMPQAHGSSSSSGAKPAQSPAQSSTLASHTSHPLGGASEKPDQRGGQESSGVTEKAKDAVQSATETVRATAGDAQKRAGEIADQASDWAQDTYDKASSWAGDTYSSGSDRFQEARGRSARAFGGARSSVQEYVAENPMVVGIVGLAAGLLIGALLPRTRKEDETFGGWADEVRQQGMRYAQDATQRGREYVEEHFTGDDPRFSRHEADFRSERNANRH